MAEKLPHGGFTGPPQVRQEPGYVILQGELALSEVQQHGRRESFAHLADSKAIEDLGRLLTVQIRIAVIFRVHPASVADDGN